MLFGGFRPAALERVARWGDGFLCAAPSAAWAGNLFRAVEDAWQAAGRDGRPRTVAQVNVALGPQHVIDDARHALGSYYALPATPATAAAGILTTPGQIRAALAQFADLGTDEVMLYCLVRDACEIEPGWPASLA